MIVVAIPTIPIRGEAWQQVADAWYEVTATQAIICVPSWRKGGWAQGLNEVWEAHRDADVFVAGSDDMRPREGWYEAVEPWLDKGVIAPQVHDPRFSRFDASVTNGQEVDMSSFPILSRDIVSQVFPFRADDPQHYFADNIVSDKARKAGYPTIAVVSCVIDHLMDERGRGAGMGDESTRMAFDKKVYKRAIAGLT